MTKSVHPIPVKIAYVGGGSLSWALTLMSDLAYDTTLSAEVRLYDLNKDAASRNARIGERHAKVSRGTPAKYIVSDSLAEALQDADVVVVSILPGTFEVMAKDIGIPARYGVPQAVGDTVGPGGFIRSMRAIPMMYEIGKAIGRYAPNAFVCNLANPMSVITGALFAAYPEIRCWGECHEVTKIRRFIAHLANQDEKEPRWSHRDVNVNVLGINHFTFVDSISLGGKDMMPAFRSFYEENAEAGWYQTEPGKDAEHARYFSTRNLVSFDLYRRFGIPAAAGDRHLAEFFPAEEYLGDPQGWGFALTPVEYRMNDRDRKLQRAKDLEKGVTEPVAKRSDEEMIDQIIGLVGEQPFISNVNLPNQGQLEGVPEGAIVETNASFSENGIKPLPAGRLPEKLEVIVADHAKRQSALLQAVVTGNRDALLPLFVQDPLVAPLGERVAAKMFDEMTHATADWLPESLRGAV